MGTSGNPAKKAEQLKISQVGDFKKRLGGIMELPSGLIVKLRNPGGMSAFITGGIIPNSLMGIVKSALDGENKEEFTGKEFLNEEGGFDDEMMDDMVALLNNIAIKTFVTPRVHPVPTEDDVKEWNAAHPDEQVEDPEELRDEETLYCDELPDDDKMFVFQWITGGTADVATFRAKHEQNVGIVAKESVARSSTK